MSILTWEAHLSPIKELVMWTSTGTVVKCYALRRAVRLKSIRVSQQLNLDKARVEGTCQMTQKMR